MKLGTLSIDYAQWLGLVRNLWRLLTIDEFKQHIQASSAMPSDSPAPCIENLLERTGTTIRDYWLPRIVMVMTKGLPELISICQSAHITKGELRASRRLRNSEVLVTISYHLAGDKEPRRKRRKQGKTRLSNLTALRTVGLGESIQRNLPLIPIMEE